MLDHDEANTPQPSGCDPKQAALHPLDAGLAELRCPASGLAFPPAGWFILQEWGSGYALQDATGLRAIIDCSRKEDDLFWVHVSVSRAKRTPSHEDMARAKQAFLGDRYAYSVWPPRREYVNIHQFCLHIWSVIDGDNGRVLPEFSGDFGGVKSI